MTEHVMDNPRAERVRKTALLATRAGRKKQGLFLAEGPQSTSEALKLWLRTWASTTPSVGLGRLPQLDALYFDPVALGRHPELTGLLDQLRGVLFDPQVDLPRHARVFLREATPEVLQAMGDADTSQGVVAVCRIPEGADQIDFAQATFSPHPGSGLTQAGAQRHPAPAAPVRLGAVLVGLQDPGNVGTIIRTCDAAGADAVVLSAGSTDPWAPKVVRSGAGSHFHLPIITGADASELVEYLKTQGMQVLAAAGEATLSLADLQALGESAAEQPDLAEPTLWLLGNEAHGLSEEQLQLADHRVAVPMYGQAESLNVAVAAGICLYASAAHQLRDSQ